MSVGAHNDATDWAQEISRISARIEELKIWSEQQGQLLQADITAQIVDLRADLRRLKAAVSAAGPDEFALKVSAQIEELNLKGDLAYKRLREQLSSAERSAAPPEHPAGDRSEFRAQHIARHGAANDPLS